MTKTFIKRTSLQASASEVFQWHARLGALDRLMPPWETIEEKLVEGASGIEVGARVRLRVRIGPFHPQWVSEHQIYDEGQYYFRDAQIRGPFARFEHTHRFDSNGANTCYLEDHIDYALPFGVIGQFFGGTYVRKRLERMFDYRHRVTSQDIAMHQKYKMKPSRIFITGSSGFIGSALIPFLTTGGHEVKRLVRSSQTKTDEIYWEPLKGFADASKLEGADAIIHLAGKNIAEKWTDDKKVQIRESRIKGTRILCESLAKLSKPPKVLVCASAIGYYGNRGVEILKEESSVGSGFLAEVCRDWEAATEPARQRGIRVVKLRIGVVLSPAGGALHEMSLPFSLGLGGKLGSGNQYMSWIAMDDMIGAIYHALAVDAVEGPVNVTAPNPVPNYELTKVLGHVLNRPAIFTMPPFLLRKKFGELADEALLASTRAVPSKLLKTGYQFICPNLEEALKHLLGKA